MGNKDVSTIKVKRSLTSWGKGDCNYELRESADVQLLNVMFIQVIASECLLN